MTSPQRQLTTELNFKYNPANLNKFIAGVKNFKFQAAAAATAFTAIALAVSDTINRVVDVAKTSIAISDIAKAAGFAADEFSAWRDAASALGISNEKFDSDFKKLSNTILSAKIGAGELFRIFRETGGKIRLPDSLLTDAENFKLIFKDIFEYINTLPSETRKLQVLGNLFSPESASRWLDAINKGFETFEKMAEITRAQNVGLDKQVEAFKELSNAFSEFSSTFAATVRQTAAELAPYITPFVKVATNAIRPEEPVRPLRESLPDFFTYLFRDRSQDSQSTVVNNIEINVPPGTTEEQSVYMADAVKSATIEAIDEQTRVVISNFPQME